MSSNLSANRFVRRPVLSLLLMIAFVLSACDTTQLNNPYDPATSGLSILYSSFSERPKHLDPAIAYSANEYTFIGQIYEPPLQYHYLKRPYQLMPLTATALPKVSYLDAQDKPLPTNSEDYKIAFTEYLLEIKPGIRYQPHPALAKNAAALFVTDATSALTARISCWSAARS